MKRLVALTMCALSLGAAAQFPSLPYNPDENGDGLIGVADLQALLANYGSEFASAVVSEDGESAIVYVGDMWFPQCEYACEQLPGFWQMPKLGDLTPVLSDILWPSFGPPVQTWLRTPTESFTTFYYVESANTTVVENTNLPFVSPMRCYCAAQQLPRVEYSYCLADGAATNVNGSGNEAALFQACCDDKVESGWFPLGGITKGNSQAAGQAFWRWAE